MIDQTSQFFAILTNIGAAKQANADALGVPWTISKMAVGDANGADPVPDPAQTRLINEWRRAPLNQLKVDPANSAIIIAEQVIPAEVGGKWIREIGLYDADDDLVAIANCAPSFKPLLSQGSGRTQVVRLNMQVSNSSNVELRIDPSIVLATRGYVDSKVMEELYRLDHKQSVRAVATKNIVLHGLQPVDRVQLVAGDRVLVARQTTAQENGIYVVVTDGPWTRAVDADSPAEVTSGLLVSVEQGATLADTRWQLTTDTPIVPGTTALKFQDVTTGFAPLNSPVLITPKASTTPAQFDNTRALATTEFVQRAQGSFCGYTPILADRLLTPEDIGKILWLQSTASRTLNIPPPSSLGLSDGASFNVFATSAAGKIAVEGQATIQLQAGTLATSFTVKIGQSARLVVIGANQWMVTDSTAGLGLNADFGALLAENGYQKLPSGDVDLWGLYVGAPSGSDTSLTLPVALSVAPYNIQLTFADFVGGEHVGSSPVLQARNSTMGSFTVRNLHTASASFFWRVRGKA